MASAFFVFVYYEFVFEYGVEVYGSAFAYDSKELYGCFLGFLFGFFVGFSVAFFVAFFVAVVVSFFVAFAFGLFIFVC